MISVWVGSKLTRHIKLRHLLCRKTIYLQNTFWSKTNINQSYYTKQLSKVFDPSNMCFLSHDFLYANRKSLMLTLHEVHECTVNTPPHLYNYMLLIERTPSIFLSLVNRTALSPLNVSNHFFRAAIFQFDGNFSNMFSDKMIFNVSVFCTSMVLCILRHADYCLIIFKYLHLTIWLAFEVS